MKKLRRKVAVVTGASKGIGASIAEHLAAEGASVIVNYSSIRPYSIPLWTIFTKWPAPFEPQCR